MQNTVLDNMFEAGVHFGLSKSRKHPSMKDFIYGVKDNTVIFDLEKTVSQLEKAKKIISDVSSAKKGLVYIGSKSEVRGIVRNAALSIGTPFVASRFIGGTFTNFVEIKKRIDKYEKLLSEKNKGELAKYTKKERLLIDKQIQNLEDLFLGIVQMRELPKVVVIVDPNREHIALAEALQKKITVIAIASSDSNVEGINCVIPANDSSPKSIELILNELNKAFEAGKATK